ncbi:hypothetical protein OG893_15280 [Streptomyces sp. NBC_01696]|uniref:hypothetical protein n=1 Tax=Streptomyces TaxID=1883 RepID=UPI002E30352F|nr:hypothetical protein [Streptomyces sp. NBC_01696]
MTASASFLESATQFLQERFEVAAPRYGSVYGIRQSRTGEDWEFDRATSSRVFIVHISDGEGSAIEKRSLTHARWSIEELRRRRREISPEGIVSLVTGYVEGWLPDGPITLR